MTTQGLLDFLEVDFVGTPDYFFPTIPGKSHLFYLLTSRYLTPRAYFEDQSSPWLVINLLVLGGSPLHRNAGVVLRKVAHSKASTFVTLTLAGNRFKMLFDRSFGCPKAVSP